MLKMIVMVSLVFQSATASTTMKIMLFVSTDEDLGASFHSSTSPEKISEKHATPFRWLFCQCDSPTGFQSAAFPQSGFLIVPGSVH